MEEEKKVSGLKWVGIIIIVIIVLFWVGSLGNQSQNSQTVGTTIDQTNQDQINQLKQEIEGLKNQKPTIIEKTTIQQNNTLDNSNNITAQELSKYLTGVGRINCYKNNYNYSSASGSLWIMNNKYFVVTNRHAVAGDKCELVFADGLQGGWYPLAKELINYDNNLDLAFIEITIPTKWTESIPVSQLNYDISKLPKCVNMMSIGSPLVLIGFPSSGGRLNRIITNGIISGHDNTTFATGLSAPDYFVSAKIDAGNSGGIALAKDSNGLCVLGIPTWVSIGEYDTQGMIQNIHNIFP